MCCQFQPLLRRNPGSTSPSHLGPSLLPFLSDGPLPRASSTQEAPPHLLGPSRSSLFRGDTPLSLARCVPEAGDPNPGGSPRTLSACRQRAAAAVAGTLRPCLAPGASLSICAVAPTCACQSPRPVPVGETERPLRPKVGQPKREDNQGDQNASEIEEDSVGTDGGQEK